jgi:hypothetical protein
MSTVSFCSSIFFIFMLFSKRCFYTRCLGIPFHSEKVAVSFLFFLVYSGIEPFDKKSFAAYRKNNGHLKEDRHLYAVGCRKQTIKIS